MTQQKFFKEFATLKPIKQIQMMFECPQEHLFSKTLKTIKRRSSSTMQTKLHNSSMLMQNQSQQKWKPKIPSKKLFEDPRFFISLQRKKNRILSGFQDGPIQKYTPNNAFRGKKKINQKFIDSEKRRSLHQIKQTRFDFFQQKNKVPDKKTPHLHFNMHYLIKKRKTLKSSIQTSTGKRNHQKSSIL